MSVGYCRAFALRVAERIRVRRKRLRSLRGQGAAGAVVASLHKIQLAADLRQRQEVRSNPATLHRGIPRSRAGYRIIDNPDSLVLMDWWRGIKDTSPASVGCGSSSSGPASRGAMISATTWSSSSLRCRFPPSGGASPGQWRQGAVTVSRLADPAPRMLVAASVLDGSAGNLAPDPGLPSACVSPRATTRYHRWRPDPDSGETAASRPTARARCPCNISRRWWIIVK